VFGDWELYDEIASLAAETGTDSPATLSARMGHETMRGDFDAARSTCRAAAALGEHAGSWAFVSYSLALLALAEGAVDPTQALADADAAVAVARRSSAASQRILPLFALSMVAQQSNPDRALDAADECIRLDRTHRKVWSGNCIGSAAKLHVDRGEIASGLRLWREMTQRLDWSGEMGQMTLLLPALADSLASIDPGLAVEVVGVSASGVIGPFAALEAVGNYERLPGALESVGSTAVESARARAASMTHDEAISAVYDAIDRALAQVGE
jgi:hypothetical protein